MSPDARQEVEMTEPGYPSAPLRDATEARLVRERTVPAKVWGDETSGELTDAIYVSTEHVHMALFTVLPGRDFRDSDTFKSLIGGDVFYFLLDGILVLANPENGEVHRLLPGDAVVLPPDTWHHGFNYGDGTVVRALEFIAPPPAQGTTWEHFRSVPIVSSPRYTQDEWLRCWPLKSAEAVAGHVMRVVGERDVLWRLEGERHHVLVGIHASTEHGTLASLSLRPGAKSDVRAHAGGMCLFVRRGKVIVHLPESSAASWHEAREHDGFHIPPGMRHQFLNMTNEPTEFVYFVAPEYRAPAGTG